MNPVHRIYERQKGLNSHTYHVLAIRDEEYFPLQQEVLDHSYYVLHLHKFEYAIDCLCGSMRIGSIDLKTQVKILGIKTALMGFKIVLEELWQSVYFLLENLVWLAQVHTVQVL